MTMSLFLLFFFIEVFSNQTSEVEKQDVEIVSHLIESGTVQISPTIYDPTPAPIPVSAPISFPWMDPTPALAPAPAPAPAPTTESAPAPVTLGYREESDMKLDNYLRRYYPNHKLEKVKGDGSCQMRAISVALLKTQDDHEILGMATNKFMLQNWEFYSRFYDYDEAFRVAGTDRMFVEDEHKKFLQTKESLQMYRDNPDLDAVTKMFNVDIDVIRTTNGRYLGGLIFRRQR